MRRQPDGVDHLGIGNSVPATCFPTASCLASSWDPELLHEVGAALGREAPLRFLVSMSGGSGSIRAFDGLTKLLSALRITGRRS